MSRNGEYQPVDQIPESLRQDRLLTDVDHLYNAWGMNGVPDDVLQGILENKITKVQEDAFRGAVSNTYQDVAEIREATGRLRRTFLWRGLGRTAVNVACSGYGYYKHPAALSRVDVEVNEAIRSEKDLRPGVAQCFISPRMSIHDAPEDVAAMEHLDEADAIRVSTAIVDADGNVVKRRMQALLVRDIPLAAWVRMLKDVNNIWGRSIVTANEQSALSVMQVFAELDIAEELLPQGPVSIIRAVVPYIDDPFLRLKVEEQIVAFTTDQHALLKEAETVALDALKFDICLAESRRNGRASHDIQSFIMQLQSEWGHEALKLIQAHALPGGGYRMSRTLEALLEEAKQKLVAREAKIVVGLDDVLYELGQERAGEMRSTILHMRFQQYIGDEVAASMLRADLNRSIARTNIEAGGGCGGVNRLRFGPDNESSEGSPLSNTFKTDSSESSEGIGKVGQGVCRVEGCPSRPAKTTVGGCCVCLKYCQPLFDKGKNPAQVYGRKKVMRMLIADELTPVATPGGSQEARDLSNKGRSDTALALIR